MTAIRNGNRKEREVRIARAKREPLDVAIMIAVQAHAGQKDKAGSPYILHPLRVMMAFKHPIEQTAAVLHDVVEDSPMTLDALRAEGIPEQAVRRVGLLTRRPGQGKCDYYTRIAADPAARRIKLADFEDNLDVRRLRRITARDERRMAGYRRWKTWLLRAEAKDAPRRREKARRGKAVGDSEQ